MKVLLLGVGMQGKAALADLVRSADVSEVVAADREIDALQFASVSAGLGRAGSLAVSCERVVINNVEV